MRDDTENGSVADYIPQSYFEKGCQEVHATIPKGAVGGFEFTVLQINLKEWHERPWKVCLRVLKESNKSKFNSYSVRNSVLIISHITFRDCRVDIFSNNLSRNSSKLLLLTGQLNTIWSTYLFYIDTAHLD